MGRSWLNCAAPRTARRRSYAGVSTRHKRNPMGHSSLDDTHWSNEAEHGLQSTRASFEKKLSRTWSRTTSCVSETRQGAGGPIPIPSEVAPMCTGPSTTDCLFGFVLATWPTYTLKFLLGIENVRWVANRGRQVKWCAFPQRARHWIPARMPLEGKPSANKHCFSELFRSGKVRALCF